MSRLIRELAAQDVAILIDWAAGEGWNPGRDDAAAFHAADPAGFIGAFVDGVLAAGISAVAYGSDFGFIGLYICRPDRRGEGHGRAVWDAGMARLDGRTIGLDGVPAQQANYARMGFVPAYRTLRFSGRFPHRPARVEGIRPIDPDLLPGVAAFDRTCFPAPRPKFLAHWLMPDRKALAIVRDGALAGYGVARQCRDGFKVGPLLANASDAAVLLSALSSLCGGDTLHIDVPEPNQPFVAILSAAGMRPGFETMRMYRGRAPFVDMERVCGITTLELG